MPSVPVRSVWVFLMLALLSGCSEPSTVEVTATTLSPATTNADTPSTSALAPTSSTTGESRRSLLVFTATAGYRHQSIPAGLAMLQELGRELGFTVVATENMTEVAELATGMQAVVFLNTTGDVLDVSAQQAMEGFMADGGGFVGIHSASDTEYDWPWYGAMLGTYFSDHPRVQEARIDVMADHPVVAGVQPSFTLTDEWYNFAPDLPDEVEVLLTLDESTYEGGSMDENHPIGWAHEYGGGRAVYLGFGHRPETFSDSVVRTIVTNALVWVSAEGESARPRSP